MTTTSVFTGISEGQKVSSRVLKPPGGGSSISFGDDDEIYTGRKTSNASAPQNDAPKTDNQPQVEPKTAETNGTSSPPQTPTESCPTATKENNSSAPTTNGDHVTNGTMTNGTSTNGTTNGTSPTNGTTNGTSTNGSCTPNSSRLDTRSRLFGGEQPKRESPQAPRIRDHHRSNIFTDGAPSINTKAANASGNQTPEVKTPEVKTPEQPQPQNPTQQRQRVPPGGFSTKLW